MKLSTCGKAIFVAIVPILILTAYLYGFQDKTEERESHLSAPVLHSVIHLSAVTDTTRALVVGYNYDLLRRFGRENGMQMDIRLGRREVAELDSLHNGSVDILVLPFEDSLVIDSALVSIPVDSQTVWVVRHDWDKELEELNSWIAALYDSPDYDRKRNVYMKVYSPFRSGRRRSICPYDSLIMHTADSVGMDWRMLAAVIYKESMFHIEAASHRGARGLMQMIPPTAESFGVTDPLDPEQNIRAGGRYLSQLGRNYAGIAEDRIERIKFALAAYNAGGGRVKDCITYARSKGIEPTRWDDIVAIIPEMRDSTAMAEREDIKWGVFQGYETIAYVEDVMAIYYEFCRISQ